MSADLTGMRAVVTGAAGGIGAAVVERLVGDGARVAALDLVRPDLPGVAFAASADVTDEDQLSGTVAEATEALGGVDSLVAVAGTQVVAPTHELDLARFRAVLEVSAVGTFLAAKAVLPAMLHQGGGQIVTFGSTAAVRAAPRLAAYAAAKGAVLQFTRSIAVEYADRGIRANCVCPGGTATPLLRAIDAERSGPDRFKARHPVGRYAEPSEIASVVAFLLSGEASFMVGAAVMVDGGYTVA